MSNEEKNAVIPSKILKEAKITPRIRRMADNYEAMLLKEIRERSGILTTQERDIIHTLKQLRVYSWEIELKSEREGLFDSEGRMRMNIERVWISLNNLAIKLYRSLNLNQKEPDGMSGLDYIEMKESEGRDGEDGE